MHAAEDGMDVDHQDVDLGACGPQELSQLESECEMWANTAKSQKQNIEMLEEKLSKVENFGIHRIQHSQQLMKLHIL